VFVGGFVGVVNKLDSGQKGGCLSKWFVSIGDGIGHLLWPAVCTNCGRITGAGEKQLCKKCCEALVSASGPDYCRRCGRDVSRYAMIDGACPLCENEAIFFDGIARSGVYDGSLREMILSFKNGRDELGEVVGFLANSALEGSDFFEKIDFFVPVPLHWSRRLSRGYNQSMILARQLKHPTAKICTELVRVRRTRTQASMITARQREKNVAGAFAVRAGHKLGGSSVCLVDDIKTTGATLNECSRILKEAGVLKVFALVSAVAGQDGI
jgi:competence protein ComFC